MDINLTEQESLRIITEMIENAKVKIRDNGFFYLLWGWLVLAALVLNYLLDLLGYEKSWLAWPVLMGGGLIATYIAGFRRGQKNNVRTFFDTTMIFLWNSFLVVLIIDIYMAGRGIISWHASNVIILSLYGMGTFVSGGLLKFRPLLFGGLFCWLMAIVLLFVSGDYDLPVFVAAVIIAYLVPGYILRNRYKKAYHVQGS